MDQSLDDFIKNNRGKIPKRGRGAGGQQSNCPAMKNAPQRGGMVSKRGHGGAFSSASRVIDARLKIIAKKRLNMVDARDQLAQLAMQTDARDKLNNLRVQRRGGGKPKAAKQVDARSKLNQNKVWRGGRQQQIVRGGVRWPQASQARSSRQPSRLDRAGFIAKSAGANFDVDLLYEEEEDYLEPELAYSRTGMFQRTVHNMVAPRGRAIGTRPAAIPEFSSLRVKVPLAELEYEDSYYDEEEMEMDDQPPLRAPPPRAPPARLPMSRAPPARAASARAPPTRAPPARPQSSRPQQQPSRPVRPTAKPSSHYPALRQDWADLQKTSIVVRNDPEGGSDGHMSQQLRSRLDIAGRFAQPPVPVGVKVLVSNLQASVTEEDIKELFGDLGPLMQWRLIRPGTAEVVYKQRAHAVSAVEVYHKRQLDGQPMNVVLVTQGQGAAPAPKFSAGQSKLGHGKGIQPDLGIIHKALFKN